MDPSKETCKLVTVPLLLSVLLLRHNHPSAARCCIFGLLDGFLRGLAKGTTDAWRMVQRWERQLLDSSDYWPNTVTEFFLDLSAATSSCTRRELSSSFETSFLMHSTSTNSLKNAAAPRYWGIPMALAFPEPQLCLLPSKICALFPLVPYMLLELGYL